MARANPAPIRFRRELHWPRRQRFFHPAPPPARVQVERDAPEGVSLQLALLIIGGTLLAGAAVTEGAIALVLTFA